MRINNFQNSLFMNNRINTYSRLVNSSIQKLSTGKRINSAADSPSDILRISRFESETRGSQVAQRNIQDGISFLQVAEGALTQIQGMGNRLKELSVQYNSDVLTKEDENMIKSEAQELLKEINHTIENTQFGELKVFDKNSYTIQTGPYSGDTYEIKLPDLSYLKEICINGQNDSLPIDNNRDDTENMKNIDNNDYNIDNVENGNKDTSLNGYQKLYNKKGILVYDGSMQNGEYHGYGRLYSNDGILLYDGSWNNGEHHGYGKLYNGEGQLLYEGNWENGEKQGFGKSFYTNGKIQYEGYWNNNVRHGEGKSYTEDGEVEYEGQWENGQPKTILNSNISDILKDNFIDKNILKPISNTISHSGIMENTLSLRLKSQMQNEELKENTLSNITDVDIAKELTNYAQNQVKLDTSVMLLHQDLANQRQYILQLLS